MRFYVGLHQPSDAQHFPRVCISVNRVRGRRSPVLIGQENGGTALLDSGAFTELAAHGCYRHSVDQYAAEVRRLCRLLNLDACVAQDYMCEPFMVQKTGLSIAEHQRLTIERYDALLAHDLPCYVLPVLQGFAPADYARHIDAYGERLERHMWVGVGSVCKRNSQPASVACVLQAIKRGRPDLRLHGFGVKLTALQHPAVRDLLYSADSMAWSYSARKQGRSANNWREAAAFTKRIHDGAVDTPWQWEMAL
jgi:hypothetical protein